MKPVDILMVCIDSTAGVMNGLCEAINKHTKYRARFVRLKDNRYDYPKDLSFNDTEELKEILEDCSAIHWNIFGPDTFQRHFDFKPYLKDKVQSRHFHGSILRRQTRTLTRPKDMKAFFVSTPDLLQYSPEAIYLPNPIYTPFKTLATQIDRWDILHMPTNSYPLKRYLQFVKHPEYYPKDYPPSSCIKSTDIFQKAVMDLQEEGYDVTYTRPPLMPFKDSLNFKQDYGAIFDQLWVGYYGVNSIEMMSLKKPAICHLSQYSMNKMLDWHNETIPIMNVNHKNIKGRLKRYMRFSPVDLGRDAYNWVRKFHDPKKIAQRFTEELLE